MKIIFARIPIWVLLILVACNPSLELEPFDVPEIKPASLIGRITLDGESKHSNVHLVLQSLSHTYSVLTGADGSLRLTGVAPGRYTLFSGARYFVEFRQDVVITSAQVVDLGNLVLHAKRADAIGSSDLSDLNAQSETASGIVSGIATLAEESDHAGIGVELQNDEHTYTVFTHSDGVFRITGVAPGDYALRLGSRYFQEITVTVKVSAGQEYKVPAQKLRLL